jgi:hypothetical protein
VKPNNKTPSGSKVIIKAFGEKLFYAIFDHIDGEFFHCYMNENDVGKKKYKTVGYLNCELVFKQGELFD